MDTDSLPSAPVFLAFLLLFSYLSLVEHSGNAGAALARNGWRAPLPELPLHWAKYACVIAVALSGLDLARSINPMGLWPLSFLALGYSSLWPPSIGSWVTQLLAIPLGLPDGPGLWRGFLRPNQR